MITPVALVHDFGEGIEKVENKLSLLADHGDAKPKNKATTMIWSMFPSMKFA